MYSDAKKTWLDWARQKRRHLSAGHRYRSLHRAVLTLVSGTQVLHFFLFAVLLLAGVNVVGVAALFLVRGLSVFFIYSKILPRLGERDLLLQVPILDALLAMYYGAFVPLVLILDRKSQTEWK